MDEPQTSLLVQRTHRFATCWKIERTDGTIFRFTDHDTPLDVDGYTFVPAGGFDVSAIQDHATLDPNNLDAVGLITSDAMTEADLRAGLFDGAEVTEILVDWRYPWAGAFLTNSYWISDLEFSGEHWQAKVEGIARFLKTKIGRSYHRTCRHVLGDSECQVVLGPFTNAGTVGTVTDIRRVFQSNLGEADDYYSYGKLTWITGNNAGLIVEMLSFVNANGVVSLSEPMPYDIVNGDTFSAIAGCDKRAVTCKDVFSNLDNFGGFPFIPGMDKILQSPMSR